MRHLCLSGRRATCWGWLTIAFGLAVGCASQDATPLTDPDKSAANSILSFVVESHAQSIAGVITEADNRITLNFPVGTSVKALVPAIEVSPGATITPAAGVAQDFTSPVAYTVTAEDGATKQYVAVAQFGKRSDKRIIEFKFAGLSPARVATIDEKEKKINVRVASQTAVQRLVPTIEVSAGATVTPASGVPQDFSKPVTYRVTAEDNSTQQYEVAVTPEPSPLFTLDAYRGATVIRHGGTLSISGRGFAKNDGAIAVSFKNLNTLRSFTPVAQDISDQSFNVPVTNAIDAGFYEVRVTIGGETQYLDTNIEVRLRLPVNVSLTKMSFVPGETFVLQGEFFPASGNTLYLVNRLAKITLTTSQQSPFFVTLTVPVSIPSGTYSLVIKLGNEEVVLFDNTVTIVSANTDPAITKLNKTVYEINDMIVITGMNLRSKMSAQGNKIVFTPINGGNAITRVANVSLDGLTATYQLEATFPVGQYLVSMEVDGKASDVYYATITINP